MRNCSNPDCSLVLNTDLPRCPACGSLPGAVVFHDALQFQKPRQASRSERAHKTTTPVAEKRGARSPLVKRILFLYCPLFFGPVLLTLILDHHGTCYEPWGAPSCTRHLHRISIALQSYHDSYGSFPPAYIPDKTGEPMHSWRVLILPFLGEQELYDKYRFDEPWNGPHNSQLHAEQSHYICYSGGLYVAVVGPYTVWPGAKATQLSDITDEPAKTIMVVESRNTDRHWMEPYDLQVDMMSINISEPSARSRGRPHHTHRTWIWQSVYSYAHVLTADGSVQRLKANTEPKTIKALLTIDGQD